MSSLFHQHLHEQVKAALRTGVAVVYDPERRFEAYFDDLGPPIDHDEEGAGLPVVHVGSSMARLCRFQGAWFGVRAAVEPYVGGEARPEPGVLIYVPCPSPEPAQDVLMELTRAGRRLVWRFEEEARDCLRARYTDGVIDELLRDGAASFHDVVAFLAQRGGGRASRLKVLYNDAPDEDILVRWLADDALDAAIVEKGSVPELAKLVTSRVGFTLDEAAPLAQSRARLARYALLHEFRHDLRGDPPGTLATQPAPLTDTHRENTLTLVRRFRTERAAAYVIRARQIEAELHLARAKVRPEHLGSIDTFEFEERLLLKWCASLLEARDYDAAYAVVVEREASFWVEWTDAASQMPRKEAWELCRRVAELGLRVRATKGDLPSSSAGPEAWVEAYAAEDGWHRVDAAQRALESWRGRISDEGVAEKAVGVALRDHERLLHDLALGFTKALRAGQWTVPGALPQTRIYPDVVARLGGKVAWFFVDALRYEMGAELARQLEGMDELHLRPAIAALPSITPVCMAALLPGASANFAVVEHKDKLAAMVDRVPLLQLPDRQRYLKARAPDHVDLTLSAALQEKPAELRKRVKSSSLVIVRSTEIDYLGETGDDHLARQAMETVIGNIARAARRLAEAGVEHFVITADHGHQFGIRKGDDMKLDPPGGHTVELHRRCWIGRGGTTPPGAVRVTAAELGYASDLEFVFPAGLGVFKTGGDLSFHHGSTSLQELVIPVLTFRVPPAPATSSSEGVTVQLKGAPDTITSRVFVVELETTAPMFAPEWIDLRVVLLSEAEQVGEVGMVSGAELDRERGVVRIKPGRSAHVGFKLAKDDVATLQIVVFDPTTDFVFVQSAPLPLNLLR